MLAEPHGDQALTDLRSTQRPNRSHRTLWTEQLDRTLRIAVVRVRCQGPNGLGPNERRSRVPCVGLAVADSFALFRSRKRMRPRNQFPLSCLDERPKTHEKSLMASLHCGGGDTELLADLLPAEASQVSGPEESMLFPREARCSPFETLKECLNVGRRRAGSRGRYHIFGLNPDREVPPGAFPADQGGGAGGGNPPDPSSSLLLVLGCTTVKAAKDIAEDILDGVVQPEFRPPPREPAASDGLDQGPGVNQELGSSLRLTLSEPHEQGGEFPLRLGLRGSAGGEGSP